ncbi:hypothetical protein [Salinicola rhizosphaerae]|uniref:Uncharacterized protein n=1 Tax=Salinicola rhizosphaerae TaxID=1443141 RepID=A0ABQ3E6R1_9GAMM|nr:hypothetical protein [Salinicola rhizosphaerae]GHB24277.1 hypothetical protein GCM10009038_24200 [Salinicola rhizosphaerae]
MNGQHRRILEAVHAESSERRGPCPFSLVAVALNVASNPGRDQVDSRIAELLRTGHLEAVEDRVRGNGLVVTKRGRQELKEVRVLPGTVLSPTDETEPSPAQPVESQAPASGSTNDADLAAEGWSIMTGLAEIAIGKLQSLPASDVAERARLYAVLRRYQRHTDSLLARYGGEA